MEIVVEAVVAVQTRHYLMLFGDLWLTSLCDIHVHCIVLLTGWFVGQNLKAVSTQIRLY